MRDCLSLVSFLSVYSFKMDSFPIVYCFRYIVPTFEDSSKSILITALMSDKPENLPRELDIDGTIMILKAFGKATGVLDDKATFTLYPVGVENPTEDKAEHVSAPVSPQSMEAILCRGGQN